MTDPATKTGTNTHLDYAKTVLIAATADVVYDALTTAAGLRAWWTPASGNGHTEGELRFWFDSPQPCVIHVEEADRAHAVRWRVTECDFLPDWVGTRPVFSIRPRGKETCEIDFVHHGLTAQLECMEMCTQGWNFHLDSLRQYAETGHGNPNGSPAERARRKVDAGS